MDERAITILEFDKIREALADETSFSGGRALAETLMPTTNPIWIAEGQDETSEAVRLLETGEPAPFGGIRDIRPSVDRAERGALLQPQELLEIADTVSGVRRLASYIRSKCDAESVLADLGAGLGSHQALEDEIRRCIGTEAQVKDEASPALAKLRAQMRTTQSRIRNKLESVLREADARGYLQEPIITVRSGRYVLPVRQEHRLHVRGIVHDQSSSGATLFVEPVAVVELGNELRRLAAEEEEEIERILTRLTEKVAAEADALYRSVHAAARIDLAFAKGRLSLRLGCVRPVIADERWLEIRKGRHPLLPAETVVPIDIWLGREEPALVITGPNTGGKTVTLKTVGLFVLMSHAGLHVPADEGTQIPLCDGVFVDIGDEQSIEQSLSTFSSHMSNIVRMLDKVGPKSLVLLDELGAGTDPTEGAALAMALLEHFIEVGCLTIATTHYSELKSFAYTEPGVQNASVEFDVQTLRPTYRLLIGVAGSSNAFAISQRLGLPPEIIERARQRLSVEEQKVEDLIRTVEGERRQAERERKEAELLRAELEEQLAKVRDERERFQRQRDALLEKARAEALELVKAARQEAEQLIGELRRKGALESAEEARAARQLLAEVEASLTQARAAEKEATRGDLRPSDLYPGMRVRVRSIGQVGEVLTRPDSGGQLQVQIGGLRVNVAAADVETADDQPSGPRERSTGMHLARGTLQRKAMEISPELDLRGLTSEEALDSLAKYLDEALLANLQTARIIHGKGTGALRTAVQKYLAECGQVKSFRLGDPSEGGSGVTVIEF